MNLCVFQGTFNPIHNAHLRVANYVADKYDFDKFLFIPAYEPPHKECDLNMSIHRFNMVKLAISGNEKFELSDIEYKRRGKSYTYITICELYDKYKISGKINFIIGTDAFRNIEKWYETDKLKELVKFIVFERENKFNSTDLVYLKEKGYDYIIESLPFENISSTDLRNKIKYGEPLSDYVTKEVEEYIIKNELYKN